MDSRKRLDRAKKKSIVDYLRRQGYHPTRKGRVYSMLSPFSDESRPSFMVYENSCRFVDYSTGEMGDIIDLIIALEGKTMPDAITAALSGDVGEISEIDLKSNNRKPFKPIDIERFTQYDWERRRSIYKYARLRKIPVNHFIYGKVGHWKDDLNKYVDADAMLFPHRNEDGNITGFKARLTFNSKERFSARGTLNFYILKTKRGLGKQRLYVVESETSASSLCSFLERYDVNAVILCFGGIHQKINFEIPEKYRNLYKQYIVIDYDGDEKLYKERLAKFKHLKLRDVKIEVKKGEDINSLYVKGMMDEHLSKLLK